MACYHPMSAWKHRSKKTSNGKSLLTFSSSEVGSCVSAWEPISLACGQCTDCRKARAREWAIRIMCESKMHDKSSFLTLTFNDEHYRASLEKRTMQLFLKRLRRRIAPIKIRFFQVGEYGSLLDRPHHHAIIFGYDFPDREPWSRRGGVQLYRSEMLESLWIDDFGRSLGYSSVGDVTFDSACYVARYVIKKINGDMAPDHYQGRLPEYTTMSLKPGIGDAWIRKYHGDVYGLDRFVVTEKNFVCRPPKYYDKIYDEIDAEHYEKITAARQEKAAAKIDDRTAMQLLQDEYAAIKNQQALKARTYEGGEKNKTLRQEELELHIKNVKNLERLKKRSIRK